MRGSLDLCGYCPCGVCPVIQVRRALRRLDAGCWTAAPPLPTHSDRSATAYSHERARRGASASVTECESEFRSSVPPLTDGGSRILQHYGADLFPGQEPVRHELRQIRLLRQQLELHKAPAHHRERARIDDAVGRKKLRRHQLIVDLGGDALAHAERGLR